MSRIPILPRWMIPSSLPSVYEGESATAIEMVSKIYGAMRTMIEDYNKFVEDINKEIAKFTGSSAAENEEFKKSVEKRLRCKFEDLDAHLSKIQVDMKKYADSTLAQYVTIVQEYIDTQLPEYAAAAVNEAIRTGQLEVAAVYDPEAEELDIIANGG